MKKQIARLREELDETQEFIDACEEAGRHHLGLDEKTCDKYASAVERQKEISKALSAYEDHSCGLFTRASFKRKAAEIEAERCSIDDVVELTSGEFSYFSGHLLEDYVFIEDRIDQMCVDGEGTYHCILILGEGANDGILVNSEGSSYARYSALMPNARSFVNDQAQSMAEEIIRLGAAATDSGKFVVSREELADHFNMDFSLDSTIGKMVEEKLRVHRGIAELTATDDRIEMIFGMDHVPEAFVGVNNLMTLWTLMGTPLENVHIVHAEENHDHEVIEALDKETFTEEGKAEWSDVLGAKVARIRDGDFGTEILVDGCEPERLEDFSKALAGQCSPEEYDRWFNHDQTGGFEMKFNYGGIQ